MQSRRLSMIEAWTNTVLAFAVSTWMQQYIMATFFGLHLSTTQSVSIVAAFTAVSVVRNYLIRRGFNAYENRRT